MDDPTIICPNCKSEIKLTESLAAPLIEATRHHFQEQLEQKETDIRSREAKLVHERTLVTEAQQNLEAQIAERLDQARAAIAQDEARKAQLQVQSEVAARAQEMTALRSLLDQKEGKLVEAQKAQVELIRKQRELDDTKREMELTIETGIQAKLGSVRDEARKEMEHSLGLKVREKEETINSMQRQIEDLKRKAEQGSQQLQGEALELELESMLRSNFPLDTIDAVPKGEFGGDLIQRVITPSGRSAGAILWEMKRTRNWSDSWLTKLRADQRAAKADIALIVSEALPKDIASFGLMDGVWITAPKCALPVAIALRELLASVALARQSSEGQNTKTELVYQYLTGPRFRHRVEAIVEQFTEMQSDLDRERKNMTKLWARREQQIRCVVEATAGMYGDLQGIAGKSIQEIEGLDFQLLASPGDEPS